jgi:hypothetical protein
MRTPALGQQDQAALRTTAYGVGRAHFWMICYTIGLRKRIGKLHAGGLRLTPANDVDQVTQFRLDVLGMGHGL